jgi:hypothetical protein
LVSRMSPVGHYRAAAVDGVAPWNCVQK